MFLDHVEIVHRHAVVQVVRARRQNVLARARRLVGDKRVDAGIEKRLLETIEQLIERFVVLRGKGSAVAACDMRCLAKRRWRAGWSEFSSGQIVVRTGVDPEQLRVTANRAEDLWLDAVGVHDDLLEHFTHLERMPVPLVVINVASSERRLVELPRKNFLIERQRFESGRVHLDNGRVLNLFKQILSVH